jgi:hypothetical protein
MYSFKYNQQDAMLHSILYCSIPFLITMPNAQRLLMLSPEYCFLAQTWRGKYFSCQHIFFTRISLDCVTSAKQPFKNEHISLPLFIS